MLGGSHDPLRHETPNHGLLAMRWDDPSGRGTWFEAVVNMAGRMDRVASKWAKKYEYYNDPQTKDRKYRIDAEGNVWMPGYSVLDLRGGFNLSENIKMSLGIENVTNRKYRRAHSRLEAEAGTNLIVGIVVDFQ